MPALATTARKSSRPAAASDTHLEDAGGYIRMSSDKQAASPERQRAEINELAAKENCRIVEWYEDHGLTGMESSKRDDFHRMLADAKARRFTKVLLYEQSRMSREDVFKTMEHWQKLREAEVDIITCQRGKMDLNSLGGLLTAIVEQHGAHDEVLKFAQRSLSGKKRNLANGKRIGGQPFAYDREVLDAAGNVCNRVDHREVFCKPRDWTSRLVLSADSPAVEAVRYMVKAVAAGELLTDIARELHRRGVKGRTRKLDKKTKQPIRDKSGAVKRSDFQPSTIKAIVTNPVYIGCLRAGHTKNPNRRGKYFQLENEVLIENTHPPMVDRLTFELAQQSLRIRQRRRRSSKPGRYLLSGLVVCGNCGCRMYGKDGGEGHKKHFTHQYGCNKSLYSPTACGEVRVGTKHLERNIFLLMQQRLILPNDARLAPAVAQAEDVDVASSVAEARLLALRGKVEKAVENLALADGDANFRDLSRLVTKWKLEATELERQIERDKESLVAIEEARATIADVRRYAGDLSKCDRAKLAHALAATIESVTLTRETVGNELCGFRIVTAHVRWQPAVSDGPGVSFVADLGSPKMTWAEVLRRVATSASPLRLYELAPTGKDSTPTLKHLARLRQAGLVARFGERATAVYEVTQAGRDVLSRLFAPILS